VAQADVDRLKEAAKGILYPSETDAPFEVVHWGKDAEVLDDDRVRQLSGRGGKEPVESDDFDEFFSPLVDGEASAAARRLVDVLRETLADIRVYRLGRISIDAFIVGRTKDGDLAGLKTKLVET
jgi:hypothetical protein